MEIAATEVVSMGVIGEAVLKDQASNLRVSEASGLLGLSQEARRDCPEFQRRLCQEKGLKECVLAWSH